VSMLPVALLAGGLATRLRPLTDRMPKSLIPVAGRPFVSHQLELLRSQGIERVVLCVGHRGEEIAAAVGDGAAFGLAVQYSSDGEALRGTGGALRRALPLLGGHFFVMYGDSYLDCSYDAVQSAFAGCGRSALMAVLRNDNRWERSNVVFKDGVVLEYDKNHHHAAMRHIDYGLCVMSSGALESFPESTNIDLADIYRMLAVRRQLAGVEMAERFFEIGSFQGIDDLEAHLSERNVL
jgi:N-acetyl-alpha-D-muramate 1-phosphate uridylyltransferase